ncbi:MAG: hypothetical protein K9N40_09325 [Candidatus Cloacimonetes bacterium]|nr:hypothetical protein [Candidatus Cloacimonadota bacterium]
MKTVQKLVFELFNPDQLPYRLQQIRKIIRNFAKLVLEFCFKKENN